MAFKRLLSYLSGGMYGGWGVWGIGRVWVMGGGALILNKNPLKMNLSKKLKILKLCIFLTQKEHPSPQKAEVYTQKTENRPTYGDFGFCPPRPPTSPNF